MHKVQSPNWSSTYYSIYKIYSINKSNCGLKLSIQFTHNSKVRITIDYMYYNLYIK